MTPEDRARIVERMEALIKPTIDYPGMGFSEAVSAALDVVLAEVGWRPIILHTEQILGGIRFDAGSYEIRRTNAPPSSGF